MHIAQIKVIKIDDKIDDCALYGSPSLWSEIAVLQDIWTDEQTTLTILELGAHVDKFANKACRRY
jgi:hypothetical protein